MKDQVRLRKAWVGHVFHSNLNSKTRGTASILFHYMHCYFRSAGTLYYSVWLLFHKPIVLVNQPQIGMKIHSEERFSWIPDLNTQQLIFGGDLNCAVNPVMGRSNPKYTNPWKMARSLSFFMDRIGSVDPWRSLFAQGQAGQRTTQIVE